MLAPGPVLAQESPPDPRFGAIESFRDPVAAVEAGVGWDRIIFYWSEIQRSGPDDWNGYHVPLDWLQLAAAQGREVVGVLKNTPAWATDGQPDCGVPRGLELAVDDPNNLWAGYVRKVASVYADYVDRWIIWNEPEIRPGSYGVEWCGTTEEYYQLLKVAYIAANQANPDVTIHLAGLTHWHDPEYLRKFLAVATRDPSGPDSGYFFDVASLHIYFRTETVPDVIASARASLADYGISKPIWVNETNAPPNSDPEWHMPQANYEIDLREQASFLLQSFALALASGAQRVAVFQWVDHDLPPGFEPFGVIRQDNSRRPAYYAFRLITSEYAGAQGGAIGRHSTHAVVTLDRGQFTTRVLWARTAADVAVTLPALGNGARLLDQTGSERAIQPVDGAYEIALPGARCADSRGCIIGGPTYLIVEETGPDPTATLPPATSEAPAQPTQTPDPTALPTPEPTATTRPTLTPTPVPSPTPSPSASPTPTPNDAPQASPGPVNAGASADLPPPAQTREWLFPVAAGSSGLVLIAVAAVLLMRERR